MKANTGYISLLLTSYKRAKYYVRDTTVDVYRRLPNSEEIVNNNAIDGLNALNNFISPLYLERTKRYKRIFNTVLICFKHDDNR